MGDFAGSLPIKVTDGTDPAKKLIVNPDGSINVVATVGGGGGAPVDIRHLDAATDNVEVSGTVTVAAITENVTVEATDLDIRNLDKATDSVTAHLAADSTVAISNQVKLDDSTPVRVQGYVSIQNSVEVVGSIDIGHISDPVYLDQDSRIGLVDGTEIIVSNTVQTRALTSATDSVTVAGTVAVSGSDLDIRDLGFATDSVTAHLAAGSTVAVTASDLDIRNLAHATDSVEAHLAAGSSVAVDGPVNVLLAADAKVGLSPGALVGLVSGTDVLLHPATVAALKPVYTPVVYFEEFALAAGANASTSMPGMSTGDKFIGSTVTVGASGKVKIEIFMKELLTFFPIMTVFQQPAANSPALSIDCVEILGEAQAAREIVVTVTNLEGDLSNVYVTIQGKIY